MTSLPKDSRFNQVYYLLLDLLNLLSARNFSVCLPDNTVIPPDPINQIPEFTIVLKQPSALRRMLLPLNELALAEGYMFGVYDIKGDIIAALEFFHQLSWTKPSFFKLLQFGMQLIQLERTTQTDDVTSQNKSDEFTPFQSADRRDTHNRALLAVQFHYDLSNDFYKLWLDERLIYSCGYFTKPDDTLETAQKTKLDLLCQTLTLKPGEYVLDMGCGWGGLLIHAVTEYGVNGLGITLSQAQQEEAQARVEALGLGDRCQFKVYHYEQLESTQLFDKIVSDGMVGHIGRTLPSYFSKAYQLLKPDGLFLVKGEGRKLKPQHFRQGLTQKLGKGGEAFIHKYVFPDSHFVHITKIIEVAELAGWELLQTQMLSKHHALTLACWLERLEKNKTAIIEEVGEAIYRCWRLGLAGYYYQFKHNHLTEYMSVFSKPQSLNP